MDAIVKDIEEEAYVAKALGQALEDISREYCRTEGKISGQQLYFDKQVRLPDNTEDEKFNWKLSGLFWKGVAKFGVTGTIISAFGQMITDGVSYKSLLGAGGKFVQVFGDLAKEAYKESDNIDIKGLLFGKWKSGSAVAGLPNVTTGWGRFCSSISKQVKDFKFSNAVTVGDKIKTATKWAGVAFSGITNAMSNYAEFGTVKSERFWKETVTETAVDVGIGILATAAATAALGASAPAVAVGTAAVGVVWVADTATRVLTGWLGGEEKGLTETISDGILDLGEKVTKGIGKTFAKWSFGF